MDEQIIRNNEYLLHMEQYEDDHRVIESIHSAFIVSANIKVIVKTTKAEWIHSMTTHLYTLLYRFSFLINSRPYVKP